ncbi:MAG TPA: PQQ-binding-like beta-propeller repeat protein [Ktedonobacteraceae bacterium]|nr:PQQ-binding-like beta-propeller repeat protein [Ktedonobacteraceae bacterium]
MSEQNEKFTLEKLDHLIEELGQDDPSLPEVRLLQDLQRAQKARDRIVTRATERVWQRLQAGERSNGNGEEDAHFLSSIPSQPLANNTRKGLLKMKHFDTSGEQPKRQGRRLFAALAAVLIVGLFVGTFALFTQRYHTQSTNSGATPHTSRKTASLPASLYYTWGGGVVKLDKQTGKVLWAFRAPDWQPSQLPSPFAGGKSGTVSASTDATVYLTSSSLSARSKNSSSYTLHEYAIDAQNGSLRWSYTSQGDMAPNSAVLSGNILYIGANAGVTIQTISGGEQMESAPTGTYLLGLNAQTGKMLWRTQLKGVAGGSPVVSNGLVYVSINGGYVSPHGGLAGGKAEASINGIEALHAQDGTQAWWASTGTIQSQSSPLVTGTLIYTITIGFDVQNANQTVTILHAFDAQSGKLRWSSASIVGVTITGVTPILANGKIYYCATFGDEANSTGKIFVLDPASGKQLQVYSLPLELYELVPVNGHMVIVYATHNPTSISRYGDSGMLELDLTFQNRLWMDNNLNGDNAFPYSPLLDNGVLYLMAETQVEAANLATGKIIWQQDLSKQVNP